MANIVRGPLIVNRGDRPIQQAVVFVASSLLVTTLAVAGVIPLPLGAAHAMPAQVLHQPGRTPNADTSRGSPRALLRELVIPRGTVAPFFGQRQHPGWERLNASTAAGSPKTLRPEVLLPRGKAVPWTSTDLRRSVTDTSQESSPVLAAVVLPKPTFNAPNYGPVRVYWQPADSSQETPKALVPELRLPVGDLTPFDATEFPHAVTDTSQESSLALLQAVAVLPPIVNAPNYGPVRVYWQPADASQETPKVLLPEAQLPIGDVPHGEAIGLLRNVVDTSQGTPDGLTAIIPFPVGDVPHGEAIALVRNVADTSQESPLALLQGVAAAPFVNAPNYGPVGVYWQSADTSQESSPALLQVTAAPFVPALWPAAPFYPSLLQDSTRGQFISEAVLPVGKSAAWASVALTRNVIDTSQSQSIALQVVVPPPPPGVTPILEAPLNKNRVWVVVNTSQGTQIGMFPAVIPSTEFAYTFIGV